MFYPLLEDVLVSFAIYDLKVIISTQSIKVTSGEAQISAVCQILKCSYRYLYDFAIGFNN